MGDLSWCNYPRKLHLGCGGRYLDGYVNIDFPESDTVQRRRRQPDIIGDFTALTYPDKWFEEIRLEHVFEHFQRHVAIGLLCQWNRMLVPNGLLKIAVPDVEACMGEFMARGTEDYRRRELIRHMWGSHEATWATHHEGWYRDSLETALVACGFGLTWFYVSSPCGWHQIEVVAEKTSTPLEPAIITLLKDYDRGDGMLAGWMDHIRSRI